VGDACANDQDCEDGISCFGSLPNDAGYCTTACSGGETCPTGTHCDGTVCILDGFPTGDPCTGSTQCHTKGCFAFSGHNACTLTCDRATPCPPLTVCVKSDDGMTLCQPNRLPVADPDIPTPRKDCSTGGSGGLSLALLALLVLGFIRRRR
jgi:MYXO-CTERM domain-containing protein